MSLQMQEENFGTCPSFNIYSTEKMADAARRAASHSFYDFDQSSSLNRAEENDDDDFEFEFVSLQKSGDCEAFRGGFPIFNCDLLFEEPLVEEAKTADRDSAIVETIRIPLEKLMIRDRDYDSPSPSSSSSSSVDELEGVPSGSYCVWKPKSIGAPNLACKKSRSTGSSSTKRWGIRDLLKRSHSDGKHSYVFFTPSTTSNSTTKKTKEIKSETNSPKELKEQKLHQRLGGDQKKIFSAHESLYMRNRTSKEEGKRKSYLPYKPDLVGCWTNVTVLGRASA